MNAPPLVLTISGSDSSGHAGMQTDNRAIHAVGGFPLNVLTAVTLQSPKGVEVVEMMSVDFVEAQLRSMLKNYRVRAIKSGMLCSEDIVHRVAEVLSEYPDIPYVLDPVLCSSSGAMLLEPAAVEALRLKLMPRACLTTPNLEEVAILSGKSENPYQAAADLSVACGQAILLKGGHATGAQCEDCLYHPGGRQYCFTEARVQTRNTRGTGCALSALIAAHLAWEPYELEDGIRSAKALLSGELQEHSKECWKRAGPSFYML